MSSYIRKITSVYVCIAYFRQKSKNFGLNRPYETYIREENFSSLKMKIPGDDYHFKLKTSRT